MTSSNKLHHQSIAYALLHSILKKSGGIDSNMVDIRSYAHNAIYHLDIASEGLAREIINENAYVKECA